MANLLAIMLRFSQSALNRENTRVCLYTDARHSLSQCAFLIFATSISGTTVANLSCHLCRSRTA